MATTPPRLPIGQRRDFQAMERTRLRAARMFEHGTSQAEVARRLHTSRQNAHRWYRKWQHGGRAALRAAGRAGRTPKLDARARRKLQRALLQGALAHGFDSDLWTCKRVVIVIERLTGVRHHPSHAWRILRAMGWTLQRPERRAAERDEDAIARWVKQDWPRIRQKRGLLPYPWVRFSVSERYGIWTATARWPALDGTQLTILGPNHLQNDARSVSQRPQAGAAKARADPIGSVWDRVRPCAADARGVSQPCTVPRTLWTDSAERQP